MLVIYLDDANYSDVMGDYMPRTKRLFGESGTRFEEFVVASPLCCPSRASYQTGQYPHNNGVLVNHGGYGSLRGKGNTLPVWLDNAGYRTAFIGKYLQGYSAATRDPSEAAPGWNQWKVLLEENYYRYKMGVDGRRVAFGDAGSDYLTDVLTRYAVRFVRSARAGARPFFLTLNHLAPHTGGSGRNEQCGRGGPVPAPGDGNLYRDEPLPDEPSFNEPDVSDKPRFIALPPLDEAKIRALEALNRCRLASLAAVDRSVGSLFRALRKSGELEDTAVFLTSDNGYLLGEHRLKGKGFGRQGTGDSGIPYEEGIHMPMLVRMPSELAAGSPSTISDITANIDLAPTILDLANAEPCSPGGDRCRTLDGRSWLPLLGGIRDWPDDRAILVEAGTPGARCPYHGVRTPTSVFLEHQIQEDGSCEVRSTEHYDLPDDPFQLDNLVQTDPDSSEGERQALKSRLKRLKSCAGVQGRDPFRPSKAWCE